MVNTFDKLGLNENLVQGLKNMGIIEPTEVQSESIPWALGNKDIIVESPTGSGKTLAFLLPLFERVDTLKREMQAIIMAPTHELVMQIDKQIKLLKDNSGIAVTSAAIIGGVKMDRQIEKLREKPHIIVGSSGRILELIKKKKITAHTIKTIVIDEGDRMLDEHNISTVKDVIKTTLRDRQLMLFSATISEKTLHIARDMMKEPQVIKVEGKLNDKADVEHIYLVAEQRDKVEILRKLLAATKPDRAIVFINKSDETELTAAKLKYHHLKAESIFGTAHKQERKKALEDFRVGRINILVASDIAARGLDIKGVTHIFNMDLPEDAKGYLHRAGRTGRMGETGTVISIVTDKEVQTIKKFGKQLGIVIVHKNIYKGQIVDAKIK